jgi:hypothetical protein
MGNGVLHLTGHPLKCGNSSALQHVFVHTSIEPTWLHMNRIYIMAAAALYGILNGSSSSSTGASCRNQHSKLQTRHAQLDTRHACNGSRRAPATVAQCVLKARSGCRQGSATLFLFLARTVRSKLSTTERSVGPLPSLQQPMPSLQRLQLPSLQRLRAVDGSSGFSRGVRRPTPPSRRGACPGLSTYWKHVRKNISCLS